MIVVVREVFQINRPDGDLAVAAIRTPDRLADAICELGFGLTAAETAITVSTELIFVRVPVLEVPIPLRRRLESPFAAAGRIRQR